MSDLEKIEALTEERRTLSEAKAFLQTKLDEINSSLLELLSSAEGESIQIGDRIVKIQRNTKYEYDWDGLKHKLGVIKWKQICDEVPNPQKLIKIAPVTLVAQFTQEVPSQRPHIRVDRAKENKDGG